MRTESSDRLNGIVGAGIGLRTPFIDQILPAGFKPGWLEITPENWINMPHDKRGIFEQLVSEFSVVAHGVSLSIGSPGLPDFAFLKKMKEFLNRYSIEHYSEHLSFSNYNQMQTYELMPVPMTEKVARMISRKVSIIEDYLERKLILENPSYYYTPPSEMGEADFTNLVLELSGTSLLLDLNNVYVNSVNHSFNPADFISKIDPQNIAYLHIAGHTWFAEDEMIIDTHGEEICSEVWGLLEKMLQQRELPVLIERDNNIPPLPEIIKEYNLLEALINKTSNKQGHPNNNKNNTRNQNHKEKTDVGTPAYTY